ncbi:MAG: hypothetical protein R6V31_12355 [Halohasta sp.]
MSRRAWLGVVVAGLLVVSLFAPAVAGQHADPPRQVDEGNQSAEGERSYQLAQGDRVIPVAPVAGEEPVESFYAYHHPYVGSREDPLWGRSFSSEGTTDYQADDTSVLLLYEGPEGVSLVAVHDRYTETPSDGTAGGSVSWRLSGLPSGGEWAVIDDEYGWLTGNETQDDLFYFDPAHREGAPGTDGQPPGEADALLSWVWTAGRTDGVAYRGLGTDAAVQIDPAFNADAYHRYGDRRRTGVLDRPTENEGYNGTVDDWELIVPDEEANEVDDAEDVDRVSLDRDEPVELRSTDSPPVARSVRLENDTVDVGEPARLSAVIENPGGANWSHEAWFRVGDTDLDSRRVTVPADDERTVEFTQRFDTPGRYELGVGDERTTLTVRGVDDNASDDAVGEPFGGDDGSSFDDDESTDDRTDGFGAVAALVALVVAVAAVAGRRRQ